MYSLEDLDLVSGTIKGKNLKEVPTSDTFVKDLMNITGLSMGDVKEILQKLKEINEIFTVEVVKEDTQNKIPAILGYVVANKTIVQNLIGIYDRKLEKIYAETRKIPKSATQILREPASYDPSLNNTPLGKIINISNMLRMFLSVMEKNPSQFSKAMIREKRKEIERELLKKMREANSKNKEREDLSESMITITKKYYEIAEEEFKKKVSLPKWKGYKDAISRYGFRNLMLYYIYTENFKVLEKFVRDGLIFHQDELEFVISKIKEQKDRIFENKKDNLIERSKIRKVYNFFKKMVDEKINLLNKDITITENSR